MYEIDIMSKLNQITDLRAWCWYLINKIMLASTQKQQNVQRELGICVFSCEPNQSKAVQLRAKGTDAFLPQRRKKKQTKIECDIQSLTTWAERRQCSYLMPCLSPASWAKLRHWVCSHSLTSQISESSGGSFLSWRRRAKTCSEWTLLRVRRLTSFISMRGNIKWSCGNI